MALDKGHPEAGFIELEPLVAPALDLVWIIVGLVALAILFGFWLIMYVLNKMLGSFSILGFHPFGFALSLINAGMKASLGLLDSNVSAFAEFLFGLIMTIWRFTFVAVSTIAVLSAREFNHFFEMTGLIGSETNRATQAEQGIAGGVSTQVGIATEGLQLQIDNLKTQEATDIGRVEGQLNDLNSTLTLDVQAIEGQLNGLRVPDLSELQTQVNGLQTELQATENTLNTTINTTIPRDVADLTQQINLGVQAAESFATGLVGGLGIGGLTQTLTALQGQVSKIATETAECLDPLCDTVTPNAKRLGHLGDLLKGLESLGIEAILIALAAECLTDPVAVVHDVSTVVHDIGDPVMAGFKDLIGA